MSTLFRKSFAFFVCVASTSICSAQRDLPTPRPLSSKADVLVKPNAARPAPQKFDETHSSRSYQDLQELERFFLQSDNGKNSEVSAIDHLRMAAEQLEAAGQKEVAAQLRRMAVELNQSAARELERIDQEMEKLLQRSQQLKQLIGRPDQIHCRCQILEMSPEAAADFYAVAQSTNRSQDHKVSKLPAVGVFKNVDEAIKQIQESHHVKVLARPEIITTSGRPAKVMSGGEFPVLIPQSNNAVSVEWRWFGMRCVVVPTVLDTGKIELEFEPEVSNRDFKNAVEVDGTLIPGLSSRRVHTKVEMNLGETLVAGGALKRTEQHETSWNNWIESAIRLAHGEASPSSRSEIVTLFMVTPTAADSNRR